jgi:hypothetical protein
MTAPAPAARRVAEPVLVTLTNAEIFQAAIAGVCRQVQNLRRGRVDRHGCTDDGWYTHCNGAIAEMVVAKASGRYWVGAGALGDLHARDVLGVQVRWGLGDAYRLVLRKSDDPADVFVLVTGRAPLLTIRGWIYGRDGQRPEYWEDPTDTGREPAYFVPQSVLSSFEDLPALVLTARDIPWRGRL